MANSRSIEDIWATEGYPGMLKYLYKNRIVANLKERFVDEKIDIIINVAIENGKKEEDLDWLILADFDSQFEFLVYYITVLFPTEPRMVTKLIYQTDMPDNIYKQYNIKRFTDAVKNDQQGPEYYYSKFKSTPINRSSSNTRPNAFVENWNSSAKKEGGAKKRRASRRHTRSRKHKTKRSR